MGVVPITMSGAILIYSSSSSSTPKIVSSRVGFNAPSCNSIISLAGICYYYYVKSLEFTSEKWGGGLQLLMRSLHGLLLFLFLFLLQPNKVISHSIPPTPHVTIMPNPICTALLRLILIMSLPRNHFFFYLNQV